MTFVCLDEGSAAGVSNKQDDEVTNSSFPV